MEGPFCEVFYSGQHKQKRIMIDFLSLCLHKPIDFFTMLDNSD